MSGRFAYSLDRETFLGNFETRADALKSALVAAKQKAEPPTEVYVGRKTAADAQVCGHAEHVIRRMLDRAKAAGDGAARFLQNVGEQEEADLDLMLAQTLTAWLKLHDRTPQFFNVEAISEHAVNPPKTSNGQADEVTEIGTGEIGTAEFPFGR